MRLSAAKAATNSSSSPLTSGGPSPSVCGCGHDRQRRLRGGRAKRPTPPARRYPSAGTVQRWAETDWSRNRCSPPTESTRAASRRRGGPLSALDVTMVAKILALAGSTDHDGEALAAVRKVTALLRKAGA